MRRGRGRLVVLVAIGLVVGATTAVGGSAPPAHADPAPDPIPIVTTMVSQQSTTVIGDVWAACAGQTTAGGLLYYPPTAQAPGFDPTKYAYLPLAGGSNVSLTVNATLTNSGVGGAGFVDVWLEQW